MAKRSCVRANTRWIAGLTMNCCRRRVNSFQIRLKIDHSGGQQAQIAAAEQTAGLARAEAQDAVQTAGTVVRIRYRKPQEVKTLADLMDDYHA